MSGKSQAVTASILWCLAAMPVQAAGGATAAEMMQRMEQTETMDAKMAMVQRMDMEEQLDAAKTCAGKDQFDCARSSLARARDLTQSAADLSRYTETRDHVQQRIDRYDAAVQVAEQERAQRADMQAQLNTARTCVDKVDFECANASLLKAYRLTQGTADEARYNEVRAYVRQEAVKAIRLA